MKRYTNEKTGTMRLFIAIHFPDEIKAILAEIRDSLKEAALQGNFSLDENLHLTLVFLGECDEQQLMKSERINGKLIYTPVYSKSTINDKIKET